MVCLFCLRIEINDNKLLKCPQLIIVLNIIYYNNKP